MLLISSSLLFYTNTCHIKVMDALDDTCLLKSPFYSVLQEISYWLLQIFTGFCSWFITYLSKSKKPLWHIITRREGFGAIVEWTKEWRPTFVLEASSFKLVHLSALSSISKSHSDFVSDTRLDISRSSSRKILGSSIVQTLWMVITRSLQARISELSRP